MQLVLLHNEEIAVRNPEHHLVIREVQFLDERRNLPE